MRNLVDDKEVSFATLTDEPERVEAELLPTVENYQEISLSQQKECKKALDNLKQRVMLTLDQKKLAEAQKLISSIENISDMFSDKDIISRVRENTSTALDLKLLAESYSKLIDSQQKLMRLDSLDGQGNAARLSLAVQFKGSNGTEVNTVIHAEG